MHSFIGFWLWRAFLLFFLLVAKALILLILKFNVESTISMTILLKKYNNRFGMFHSPLGTYGLRYEVGL